MIKQYLGSSDGILDEFPELDAGGESYPAGIVENDLFVFRTLYREHCKVGVGEKWKRR